MIENQIGKRFAEALSDAITDEKELSQALDSLKEFRDAFEAEPNLYRFFIHPSYPEEQKKALVNEMCERSKAGQAVRNLMGMLVDRQKIPYIRNITEYFEQFVDGRLNQVRVKVIAASPVGQADLDKLKTLLDRQLGKTAILEPSVDPSLIGGLRLVVGSRVADATIKNRLALLKRMIQSEEVLSELASG